LAQQAANEEQVSPATENIDSESRVSEFQPSRLASDESSIFPLSMGKVAGALPTPCPWSKTAPGQRASLGDWDTGTLSPSAAVFVPATLSPSAEVFVPSKVSNATELDTLAQLPWSHRQMLRGSCEDPNAPGESVPYFVGVLKSYSNLKGFGFVACSQTEEHWHRDVFIHKTQVPVPWHVGQPVEFSILVNAQGQPQASDCLWLPHLPQFQKPRTQSKPQEATPFNSATINASSIFSTKSPSVSAGVLAGATQAAFAPSYAPPSMFNLHGGSGTGTQAEFVPNWRVPTSFIPSPLTPMVAPPLMPNEPPVWLQPRVAKVAGHTTAYNSVALPAVLPEVPGSGVQDETRYLGTLKGVSAEKNFGFLVCDEARSDDNRDIHFDKSQQLDAKFQAGATVEFSLVHNHRGQPQARDINWSPIPLQTLGPTAPDYERATLHQSGARAYAEPTLEKIKKLLRLMNGSDMETAIVTAIEFQGGNKKSPDNGELDIDYVVFVLDRLEPKIKRPHAPVVIKDFVKMLLLLMLSKMLRKLPDVDRTQKLARWAFILGETIDPTLDSVKTHIKNVVVHVNAALNENPHIHDRERLRDVLQKLQVNCASVPPISVPGQW